MTLPRIYPLLHDSGVALVSSPVDLGDVDYSLTAAQAAQLTVLLWMPPLAAVMLAQQLLDVASTVLTPDQLEQVLATLPSPAVAAT